MCLGNASWDWTGGATNNLDVQKNVAFCHIRCKSRRLTSTLCLPVLLMNQARAKKHLPDVKEWYRSEEQRQAAGIAKGSSNWTPTGGFVAPGVIDNGDGTYRPNDIYINP